MMLKYVHEMRNPQGALCLIALASGCLIATPAMAYESYHDPALSDQGYCAACHPGFGGGRSDTLHALHTGGSDPVTQNCDLCHTGSSRDNPLTMWSTGDSGTNGLGCMGCHGNDYGETIQANYRGFAIAGRHKNSGYGLRRHHARSGVAICATCNTNDANVQHYGENVIDPGLGFTRHYYLRSDVSLGGQPVNPCNNEHSLNNTNDTRGLDNDGDRAYGPDDPDCNGAPVTLKVTLTATNSAIFSWPYTFDGWQLQVNSSFGSSNWVNVAKVPQETTNSPNWRVVLWPVEATRFYRLTKSR